jgi:hypothetical protein
VLFTARHPGNNLPSSRDLMHHFSGLFFLGAGRRGRQQHRLSLSRIPTEPNDCLHSVWIPPGFLTRQGEMVDACYHPDSTLHSRPSIPNGGESSSFRSMLTRRGRSRNGGRHGLSPGPDRGICAIVTELLVRFLFLNLLQRPSGVSRLRYIDQR